MEKEIVYDGAVIKVNEDGTIIWNGKVRNIHYDACSYPVVSIKTDRGWRNIGVARLIAMAFIPNPDGLPEINHKNYDRKDFRIENLEWITHADNIRYSVCNLPDRHGKNNPNFGNHKLSEYYKAHSEYAKEKQGRPGKRNGRYRHGRYMSVKCNDYPEMGVAGE